MKKCPLCKIPLAPVDYTGFTVLHCGSCQGHLVDISRLDSIKRVAHLSRAELSAEAAGAYHGDHTAVVKCPACFMPMRKQPVPLPGLTLQMDVCTSCALIWLDGGELALVQLQHRTTPAFREAQEMKRRTAALDADPERKAAFEQNLANLPEEKGPLQEVTEELLQDAAWAALAGGRATTLDLVLNACLSALEDCVRT